MDSYLLSSIKLRLSMMRASLYRSPRNLKPPGDSQRESEDMAPRLSKSCCVHSYLCILYHDTIRDGILPKNNSKERPYYQQVYTRDRWYFTRSNIKRPRLCISKVKGTVERPASCTSENTTASPWEQHRGPQVGYTSVAESRIIKS